MTVAIVVIIICTIAIWWCSEQLAHGTDTLGRVYKIPAGVRGATLDAVASSFPEFCAVVFALIAGQFDAGVGVVAGSALFNILVIPAVIGLSVGGIEVRSAVIKRDGLLYVLVVIALILALYFGPTGETEGTRVMSVWTGVMAIVTYCAYVGFLVFQARQNRQPAALANADTEAQNDADENHSEDDSIPKSIGRIVLGMIGVGIACHFLVEYGLELVHILGFSAAVAGVTVLAAATSLPDTLLSVFAARRGGSDGAIANAFASNTFDILICLGLTIVVMGGLEMNWDEGWSILICLLLSTMISLLFMITDWKITRTESAVKLLLYVAFCVSIFLGWL